MVAAVMAGVLVICQIAGDMPPPTPLILPQCYAAVGRAAIDFPDFVGGSHREIDFFICVTDEASMLGWSTPRNHQETQGQRFVTYASGQLENSLLLILDETANSSMDEFEGVQFEHVVEQSHTKLSDHASWIAATQSGEGQSFAPPLQLCFPAQGVDTSDVLSLINSPAQAKEFKCGLLTIDRKEDGVRSIRLLQSASHMFTTNQPGVSLKDSKFGPFKSGLESATIVCTYSPSLSSKMPPSWSCELSVSMTGASSDHKEVQAGKIDVHKWIVDASDVKRLMSKYLALVPEGENIVSDKGIVYQWKNARKEARVDQQAVRTGEGANFSGGSSFGRSILIINFLLIVIGFGFFYFRRRA